jgi:hypothetical protein
VAGQAWYLGPLRAGGIRSSPQRACICIHPTSSAITGQRAARVSRAGRAKGGPPRAAKTRSRRRKSVGSRKLRGSAGTRRHTRLLRHPARAIEAEAADGSHGTNGVLSLVMRHSPATPRSGFQVTVRLPSSNEPRLLVGVGGMQRLKKRMVCALCEEPYGQRSWPAASPLRTRLRSPV